MSAKDKLKTINEDFLKQSASRITEADFNKVISKSDEIRNKFQSGGPLGRFIDDAKLLLAITKDYWTKKYTSIPWWAISAIVAALLYIFSPVDLIPDFIPGVGLLDDAAVLALCLMMVEQELHKYKSWKINRLS